MQTVTIQQSIQVQFNYPVSFTKGAFELNNKTLAQIIACGDGKSPRMLVVIDEKVYQTHKLLVKQIKRYALAHKIELITSPLIVAGGESVKTNQQPLDEIYQLVANKNIDRHSYILVIGGGAVIDAVGYAAATAHRGIRLIRMPSTVLSQNDAGIGVKNGVNYANRKNFLGTFAPPFAVINDFGLLHSLEGRDKLSGMAEAVKVALIKDRTFFDELYNARFELQAFKEEPVQRMIVRCAELHLDHIRSSGDPFEMGMSRPLDFGHWSAHKLEALSHYQLRHGEAVAIGIALDTLYARNTGMIGKSDCEKVLTLLQDLGFTLTCPELLELDVLASLEEFREHIGGHLSITMLTSLGSSVELEEIDATIMQECVCLLSDNDVLRHVSQ